MENRLTWKEIVDKFPDKWVGLVDVEWEDEANVKSAVDMILSATMFRNLIYEIDDKNHRLNATIPDDETNVRSLVIQDENGKLHVLVQAE